MKRNANGNGSVRKISVARDGKTYTYWQARYSAGFDPGTGKQKQHSITGKTQKEVLQKLKAATAAIDNGSYIEPSAMTVAQWLQSWSDNYLEGIKPSTAYLYRRSIALYLTPNLGAVKLCALKTQQIQAFYNDLLRPGKRMQSRSRRRQSRISMGFCTKHFSRRLRMGIFGRILLTHAAFRRSSGKR